MLFKHQICCIRSCLHAPMRIFQNKTNVKKCISAAPSNALQPDGTYSARLGSVRLIEIYTRTGVTSTGVPHNPFQGPTECAREMPSQDRRRKYCMSQLC